MRGRLGTDAGGRARGNGVGLRRLMVRPKAAPPAVDHNVRLPDLPPGLIVPIQ